MVGGKSKKFEGMYWISRNQVNIFRILIMLCLISVPDIFTLAGKFILAYVPACGEKEYYLASACQEIYAPPSAYFSLFGLTVQASFVRGQFLSLKSVIYICKNSLLTSFIPTLLQL